MSWLARSIANSLRLDDDDDAASSKDENDAVPRPTPNDAVQPADGDPPPSDGDEDLAGRGVKEDLSELKESLARQLWGVASFLAPPPPPPPLPPPPYGRRSDSLHTESKSDNDEEEEDKEKEKSGECVGFEEYYANIIEDAVGIREEVLAFARNIAHHPETWLDFPLSDEQEFDDFEISDTQYKHALAVEHLAPRLAALRIELCPVHMSEGYFWMVYFVLLHSRLNKHDADLLSSPQLVQARIMWMQELQKRTKEESSWLGFSTFHSKETSDSPRSNLTTHSNEDGRFGNTSEPISPAISSTHQTSAEHEIEKNSVNEVEFIDKSVIKEDSSPKFQEKEMIVDSLIEIRLQNNHDDDDEDDDWLKEDSDLIVYSGLSNAVNEEDISFSDLEDDLDCTMPIKYKMASTEGHNTTIKAP